MRRLRNFVSGLNKKVLNYFTNIQTNNKTSNNIPKRLRIPPWDSTQRAKHFHLWFQHFSIHVFSVLFCCCISNFYSSKLKGELLVLAYPRLLGLYLAFKVFKNHSKRNIPPLICSKVILILHDFCYLVHVIEI